MRDEVNEPLGMTARPPSAAEKYGPAARRVATGLAVVVAAAGAVVLWRAPPSNGGQPFAVAQVEMAPPVAVVASATPAPAPPVAASADLGPMSSGDQVEAASGVKVVRNGGGGASSALIIEVPQALGVSLTPAPDPRLIEKSHFGSLPRIGTDGARPADVYARPVVESARTRGAPRIAILVGGLGIDADGTRTAISRLPGAISLAFAPYGGDLEADAARAREAGHEILLQAPMEPFAGAASPGPHTLLTSAPEGENRDSLRWMMTRFPGFVGVTNYLGGKFTADSHAFSPILAEIASRGLDFLDDGTSPRSLATDIAPTLDLRAARADVVLDAAPTADGVEAALTRLEAQARRQGVAIGVATALPVSVDRIARWAASLEARGLSLVPVSALIARGPAPTAQSGH